MMTNTDMNTLIIMANMETNIHHMKKKINTNLST